MFPLFARAGKLQCTVDVIRLMVASIILNAVAGFSGIQSSSSPLSPAGLVGPCSHDFAGPRKSPLGIVRTARYSLNELSRLCGGHCENSGAIYDIPGGFHDIEASLTREHRARRIVWWLRASSAIGRQQPARDPGSGGR